MVTLQEVFEYVMEYSSLLDVSNVAQVMTLMLESYNEENGI